MHQQPVGGMLAVDRPRLRPLADTQAYQTVCDQRIAVLRVVDVIRYQQPWVFVGGLFDPVSVNAARGGKVARGAGGSGGWMHDRSHNSLVRVWPLYHDGPRNNAIELRRRMTHMPDVGGVFPCGSPDYPEVVSWHVGFGNASVSSGGVSVQRQPIMLAEHSHRGTELHVVRAVRWTNN